MRNVFYVADVWSGRVKSAVLLRFHPVELLQGFLVAVSGDVFCTLVEIFGDESPFVGTQRFDLRDSVKKAVNFRLLVVLKTHTGLGGSALL